VFDLPDGGGRLLRSRSGHSAPPNKVRFHGNDGLNVLSAGVLQSIGILCMLSFYYWQARTALCSLSLLIMTQRIKALAELLTTNPKAKNLDCSEINTKCQLSQILLQVRLLENLF
jgi:hypothetical protein